MINLLLLGLLGLTTAYPQTSTPQSDSPTSTTPLTCLGPNLLSNSDFSNGAPLPSNWSLGIMAPPPPASPPHVPYPLTNVEHVLPSCGVSGSPCFQVFWGSYPGTPSGLIDISEQGSVFGGFVGQQGARYELSVAYKLEKKARRDANLTCWASTDGTWTPPQPSTYVVVVELGSVKVGNYHWGRGTFDGFVGGNPVNTVGCSLWFGPGGFDSVLDIDNVEVRQKKC
jgi:hypothetical protein